MAHIIETLYKKGIVGNFHKDSRQIHEIKEDIDAEYPNDSTRKNVYYALAKYSTNDRHKAFWTKYGRALKEELDSRAGEPTAKQLRHWTTWDNIIRHVNAYSPPFGGEGRLYKFIMQLYTMIPPLRGNYRDMYILGRGQNDDISITGRNYYIQGRQGTFLFRRHKTIKKVGSVELKIPHELNTIILQFIAMHKSPMLLGREYTRVQYGKVFKNAFKSAGIDNMDIQLLRNIYATYSGQEVKKKLMDDSRRMLHSPGIHMNRYIKNIAIE